MRATRWSTCAKTGNGTRATYPVRGTSFSTRSSPTRPQTSSATGRSSCAPSVSDLRSPPRWPLPLASTTSSASAAGRRPGRKRASRWRLHERKPQQIWRFVGGPCRADPQPYLPGRARLDGQAGGGDRGAAPVLRPRDPGQHHRPRPRLRHRHQAGAGRREDDPDRPWLSDVRDHLLTLPGVQDAGVDIVYEPVWTPERMSEEARWELGMV